MTYSQKQRRGDEETGHCFQKERTTEEDPEKEEEIMREERKKEKMCIDSPKRPIIFDFFSIPVAAIVCVQSISKTMIALGLKIFLFRLFT